MGLRKVIALPNGIHVTYHRVASLNVITNQANVIEVASYISEGERDKEKVAYETAAKTGEFPEVSVFIETAYHEAPYDQGMTVAGAYGWLKANAGFGDAEDVLDEAD